MEKDYLLLQRAHWVNFIVIGFLPIFNIQPTIIRNPIFININDVVFSLTEVEDNF